MKLLCIREDGFNSIDHVGMLHYEVEWRLTGIKQKRGSKCKL